ncbi:MAG: sigma-70 family RNA polymerase sigma factor [Proteobacteria bacterium]|nr:sigma-70 family RNA polymerase sigma factor [Pseudomonadota bacterium]
MGSDAFRRITSFYRYTGLTPDDAEDLSADAVEHIIAKLPSLRKASSYDAWMWTIARNLLRSWWRAADRRRVQEPIIPAMSTPDEQAVISEEHELIIVAIRTLSLKDRELLWLREVLDLDYRSIADRTESNPAAVRVSCHRARQRLQKAFELADRGRG